MPVLATVWNSNPHASSQATGSTDQAISDDALCAEAPRLRRLVHRLLGWRSNANDLDDIVQDVLLAAFHKRAHFRGDSSLSTWLTQIALHKAHDHARSQRLRRRLFSWLSPDQPQPAAAPVDERLDRTHRAMQQLAHKDREVLVLRYLEQREPEGIAQLLGCSRAVVDTRLSRARKRLRKQLGEEERS